MLLLLMRHGIAQPSEDATDDFSRELTGEGRDRAHYAARGLHKLVPSLDFLASSPKKRARQTAQIVRDVFDPKSLTLNEWDELTAGNYPNLLNKLAALNHETVLLCGHEPHLSEFVSFLLCGNAYKVPFEFKKAGVCALEVQFAPLSAILLWHIGPKALRKIGR